MAPEPAPWFGEVAAGKVALTLYTLVQLLHQRERLG